MITRFSASSRDPDRSRAGQPRPGPTGGVPAARDARRRRRGARPGRTHARPAVERFEARTLLTLTFSPVEGSPFGVGDGPADVETADFDGNGTPDLVTVNSRSDDLTIILSDGEGGLTEATGSPIDVGDGPSAVEAGDLDGDGTVDLAVPNNRSGDLTILLGGGDGTFAEASGSPITVSTRPTNFEAGDLDGDGTIDLVVSDLNRIDLTVLLGDGDGTFAEATNSPFDVGRLPSGISITDLDLDGAPELAIAVVSLQEEDALAIVRIFNDDARVSIADVAVPEGDAGTTAATFTVSIPFPSPNTVTVDYATTTGSATEGVDYTAASGTATIAPGETTTTITVDLIGDTVMEPDETFGVLLSDPTNATLADDSATGTIRDDDATIALGTDALTVKEGEPAFLTVTRNGMGSAALERFAGVEITFASADGDSAGDEDYFQFDPFLTFAPFEVTKRLAITPFDDDLIEPAETFTASISDLQGVGPGTPQTAVLTIAASTARFLPVSPNPRRTPVDSVDVEFTEPIDLGTFTSEDLILTRDGTPVPLPEGLTITQVEETARPTYRIGGLGEASGSRGSYSLSIDLAGISDASGNSGEGTVSEAFDVRPAIVPADYDGDGITDLAVYRYDEGAGVGRFHVRQSSRLGQADEQRVFDLGILGAIPLVGDFDGDGISDPAVADPNAVIGGGTIPNATVWTYLSSSEGFSPVVVPFGAPGILDRPAPADYDGDGITDIATLRPDSDLVPGAAEWFIRPSTNINGGFRVQFGAAGGADLPVPADYDGDGVDDIASYRPDSDLVPGAAQWFVLPSSPNLPRYENTLNAFPVTFGDAGNLATPADYDGDGRVDISVFRSDSNLAPGRSQWFVLTSEGPSPGFGPAFPVTFGDAGNLAAPGDYDGDTLAELAVFDATSGTWMIRPATLPEGKAPESITFGPSGSGVVPVLSPLFDRLRATGNLPVPAPDPGPSTSVAARRAGRPSIGSMVALASFDASSTASRSTVASTDRDDSLGRLFDATLDDLADPRP